ncbi:hypothetical protein ABKN59_008011 [Abortiporus biennis]
MRSSTRSFYLIGFVSERYNDPTSYTRIFRARGAFYMMSMRPGITGCHQLSTSNPTLSIERHQQHHPARPEVQVFRVSYLRKGSRNIYGQTANRKCSHGTQCSLGMSEVDRRVGPIVTKLSELF